MTFGTSRFVTLGRVQLVSLCRRENVKAVRETLVLDDDLVARVKERTGLNDLSALVYEALKELVARESARRPALMGRTELDLTLPHRRRPEPE